MAIRTESYRTNSIVTGVLFLLTDITAIVGLFLYQPLLTDPGFITSISANNTPIIVGVILETILAACIVGTAVTLYPILKRQDPSLALGYVVFRAMEATVILIGAICLLTILSLRQQFLISGGDVSLNQTIGSALVAFQKWTFLLGPNMIFPINATLLGYLLYQSRLVPRGISALYLFDGPLLFISSLFVLFGLYGQTAVPAVLIAMPMLAFEVIFSVWLFAKGFDRQALDRLVDKN